MTKILTSMMIFCGAEQVLRSWVFTRFEASQSDICRGAWMQQVFRVLYPQSAAGRRFDESSTPQQHQPSATWYQRRAVQTSLQTRRYQPPCLSVCRASNRQCQTLQTASGNIHQSIPPIQPSAYTGVIRAVCCKPGLLKTPSIRLFSSLLQLRSRNERGTRRTNWLAVG